MNITNSVLPFSNSVYPVLEREFLNNTLHAYLSAIILFLLIFIGIRIFRKIVLIRLDVLTKKTSGLLDDRIVQGIKNISRFFTFFLAFYLMVKTLRVDGGFENFLDGIFFILLVYEIIKFIRVLVQYFLERKTKEENKTAIYGLRLVITIILWSVGILLILSNLGVNISALSASMGIGGIAVALAIQNILGDLFSSFSIYLDKPFQIGDYIVLGEDKGTVTKIGLKTTRIRTLQGEELVISNKELTSSRVQNFKKMKRRRISFSLGVEYSTLTEKLRKIPKIIENIVSAQEKAEFIRCHFATFGDFSLNIEIVYFVDSDSYAIYMDTQQRINLAIKDAFETEEIEMAFPTQTILLKK